MLYYVYAFLRGETPSADPTHQKRGPRRSHRTGRRGRLPFKLAHPRRGLHDHLIHYKSILDELVTVKRILTGRAMEVLVAAFSGGSAA